MLLENKIALITGAASGIGEATARLFLSEGASVALADLDADRGAALAEVLGEKSSFTCCDVTSEEEVAALINATVKRHGRLDCAVNNAGIIGGISGIESTNLDEWQRVISVNLTSVFICLKHELRQMQRQGAGAIVNISSGAGLVPVANQSSYCASKHGVLGLTKTAATENIKKGIRINAVLPGCIRTPMLEQILAMGEEAEKMILSNTPCGRFGEAEEIAQNVAWLCSDRASYVSGESMSVDYATLCR